MVENYDEALDFLYSQLPMYQRSGATAFKKNLDNIYALLDHLGNPHQNFKSIHIAGTNGKGSTAHFLSSILMEAGLKVGMYTSPHYIDFRERIKINGSLVSEQFIVDFINENQDLIIKVRPSFFEMCVALSFEYFCRQNVDIAVIETGLGGRLDSTNVITPLLSLITNIDYDHQDMLGDTLELIATEKAGIIKEGVPVVIGEDDINTQDVFIDRAEELNAPLIFAHDNVNVRLLNDELIHLSLQVKINETSFSVRSGVAGAYQVKNINLAISAVDIINQYELLGKIQISQSEIKKGIAQVVHNTYFLGRWQVLSESPITILDSGHNVQGIKQALLQISEIDYEQLHIVTGFVGDKNWKEGFALMPRFAQYYYARPDIPRGLDVSVLSDYAIEQGFKGKEYKSVEAAYKSAVKNASEFDLVLVLGSIFVAAEVLPLIKK